MGPINPLKVQLTLEQQVWTARVQLIRGFFFSINTYSTVNVFLPHDLLNNIFCPLAYFIARIQQIIQQIIHITYKLCVTRLRTLLIRLPVNSSLLVVRFWGSQQLNADLQLYRGQCPNFPVAPGSTYMKAAVGIVRVFLGGGSSLAAGNHRSLGLPRSSTTNRVAPSHGWLFKCKFNKIENSVSQMHYWHFKCSLARCS